MAGSMHNTVVSEPNDAQQKLIDATYGYFIYGLSVGKDEFLRRSSLKTGYSQEILKIVFEAVIQHLESTSITHDMDAVDIKRAINQVLNSYSFWVAFEASPDFNAFIAQKLSDSVNDEVEDLWDVGRLRALIHFESNDGEFVEPAGSVADHASRTPASFNPGMLTPEPVFSSTYDRELAAYEQDRNEILRVPGLGKPAAPIAVVESPPPGYEEPLGGEDHGAYPAEYNARLEQHGSVESPPPAYLYPPLYDEAIQYPNNRLNWRYWVFSLLTIGLYPLFRLTVGAVVAILETPFTAPEYEAIPTRADTDDALPRQRNWFARFGTNWLDGYEAGADQVMACCLRTAQDANAQRLAVDRMIQTRAIQTNQRPVM